MEKSTISPTGWWIAGLLEKHSFSDRPPFWNNYRLVKADDWKTAFRKATEMGLNDAKVSNEAFAERQEFVGISELVPIYDEFEDGAELLWEELESSEDNEGIPLPIYTEIDLELIYENQSE